MLRTDQQDTDSTDEQLLVGGPANALPQPGDDDDTAQAAPALVTVKISGKTFQVDPDMAAALTEREDSFNRRFSEQGHELGELRRTVQGLTVRTAPADPEPDPDIEFYSAPSKAVEKRLQAEREKIVQQVRDEYTRERARERFWADFYGDHRDLVGKEVVVEAVVLREWDDLKDRPGHEARQVLATKVREVLGAPAKEPSSRKALQATTIVTERPAQGARQATRPAVEESPRTLSAVLRKRAAARREAAKSRK
jgi:hypothetical protein